MAQPKGFFKEGGKTKPRFEKKGIKESDMRISVKGNNDTITVGTKKSTGGMERHREPWKQLPESERRELIPRIWNETLTESEKNSALDELIGDNVKFSEYREFMNSKWSDLPKEVQDKLLEYYKYRTTLRYDSDPFLENIDKNSEYYVTSENGLYVLRQKRFMDNLKKGKEHPHDVMAYARTPEEMGSMYRLITNYR